MSRLSLPVIVIFKTRKNLKNKNPWKKRIKLKISEDIEKIYFICEKYSIIIWNISDDLENLSFLN